MARRQAPTTPSEASGETRGVRCSPTRLEPDFVREAGRNPQRSARPGQARLGRAEGTEVRPRALQTGVCPVTLALEGGGSLGAFTWGVLDRLVDVPRLRIEAVSGS